MRTAVIKTFDNYFSANIILTRLQQAGIHCYLQDETTGTIYPVLLNSIGGIKLTVDIQQIKEAGLLLEQFEKEYAEFLICSKCYRKNIDLIRKGNNPGMITKFLSWLFPGYKAETEKVYHCRDCGYESASMEAFNPANN